MTFGLGADFDWATAEDLDDCRSKCEDSGACVHFGYIGNPISGEPGKCVLSASPFIGLPGNDELQMGSVAV